MRNFTKWLCAALLLFTTGKGIAAQQITASIRGTVLDQSGAGIQGAAVSVRQTETGLSRTTMSDRAGDYVLLELPVGSYELQVEAKGFQTYIQRGITLNVNETASIPVRLVIGAESQQVQVVANAQLIEQTITSLGKTVSERQVLDLPLDG